MLLRVTNIMSLILAFTATSFVGYAQAQCFNDGPGTPCRGPTPDEVGSVMMLGNLPPPDWLPRGAKTCIRFSPDVEVGWMPAGKGYCLRRSEKDQ